MRHPPLEVLKTVFEKFHAIQAVYLFGSSVSGRTHVESDLDLAVLADENNLSSQKLDILTELAKNGFCNVDLVILPGNDVVLQYEAVRLNRIVYQRPDFDSSAVFSLFVRRYLDFLPYLKVQREAYKQRILHGQG
jgi:predicted nucleotidyltransferase